MEYTKKMFADVDVMSVSFRGWMIPYDILVPGLMLTERWPALV